MGVSCKGKLLKNLTSMDSAVQVGNALSEQLKPGEKSSNELNFEKSMKINTKGINMWFWKKNRIKPQFWNDHIYL